MFRISCVIQQDLVNRAGVKTGPHVIHHNGFKIPSLVFVQPCPGYSGLSTRRSCCQPVFCQQDDSHNLHVYKRLTGSLLEVECNMSDPGFSKGAAPIWDAMAAYFQYFLHRNHHLCVYATPEAPYGKPTTGIFTISL